MDFAEYPGLNGELAADFHARHFVRRDTHVYDPNHVSHLPPYNAAALAGLAVDVKPRLTKEQHDVLENEFQKQSKPNTNTKKRFAEVLGVSLDKVNNWFQNRRAKSKQDAKKQAGAFNLLQATHQQPSFPAMNQSHSMSSDNVSPTYCAPDVFNGLRDSAIHDGPMSNGLGISQADSQANMMNQEFGIGGQLPMSNMGGFLMQHQRSQQQHSISQETCDDENSRQTLGQGPFDTFANPKDFMPVTSSQGSHSMSATITNPAEIYGEYDFPDLYDFKFDDSSNNDVFSSTPMRPSHSTDSYMSNPGNQSDTMPSSVQGATVKSRSTSSTPSVSITPANQVSDPFEYGLSNQSTQSIPASGAQWQPGQSIPVDLAALQQEFEEAALRNRTQSVPAVPSIPARFLEQPLAFPNDDTYPRRESSTVQLARSMQNFTMTGQRSAMPSSTIAARRQRPKPAPLGGASLRSTSFANHLPSSPSTGGGHPLPTGGQTLRRIKSSQTMNGIANGRIQKNAGNAQRSPSGVSFADIALANNRFARRASAFAGMQMPSAGLAPPTPMSPSSYANLQLPNQNTTQGGIRDQEVDPMNAIPSSNFSPPTTPVYAAQFSRGRLGSTTLAENTPPQSAPATQQCFPNAQFSQQAPHIQPPMSAVPVLQSQAHGFVPMMSNEYPQMPNVVYPQQQQQQQQEQQQLAGQYMDMPMSYIMTNTGEVHMGYALVPPYAQMGQQATPPHSQNPFVPSSNSSPGHMVSSQVPKHNNPAADFFVHEYTPPQDVKQTVTPRKTAEGGPKNYTFSNHGPEYFERTVKKHHEDSSPTSSAGGSSTA